MNKISQQINLYKDSTIKKKEEIAELQNQINKLNLEIHENHNEINKLEDQQQGELF